MCSVIHFKRISSIALKSHNKIRAGHLYYNTSKTSARFCTSPYIAIGFKHHAHITGQCLWSGIKLAKGLLAWVIKNSMYEVFLGRPCTGELLSCRVKHALRLPGRSQPFFHILSRFAQVKCRSQNRSGAWPHASKFDGSHLLLKTCYSATVWV